MIQVILRGRDGCASRPHQSADRPDQQQWPSLRLFFARAGFLSITRLQDTD
jgi:hypothetical protein